MSARTIRALTFRAPDRLLLTADEDSVDHQPRSVRRPRSRNRFVDLFLDAAFSFTGPAQVSYDDAPPRGPRTEEEARAGFGRWERVTIDGHSYLVERPAPEA